MEDAPPDGTLPSDASLLPGVIRWPRGESRPAAVSATCSSCLWAGGWLAGRRALLDRLGLAPDSELPLVVTAAYLRWGRDFPTKLEGAVSAIVWEAERRALLMVADRLGHQDLAYTRSMGDLWAAPSLEFLVEALDRPPDLDELSVVCFVGGDAPAPGRTCFRSIATVPAGHWIALTPERVESDRYWQPELLPVLELASDHAYADRLRRELAEVIADYGAPRIGVTLTSGLDSNTVAAVLRQVCPSAQVTGFAWSSPELPIADEFPVAQRVARHLGVDLVEIRADHAWPLSNGDRLTARSSPFRNYYEEVWDATFRAVRERGLDLLLTGAGGDNLFGGRVYSHPDLFLQGRWLELAGQIRDQLPHSRFTPWQMFRRMIARPIVQAYLPTWQERLVRPPPWLAERHRERFRRTVAAHDPPLAALPGRYLRLCSLRDRSTRRVLPHLARQGARHGVRLLHPLLDRRLVEFAARLPSEQTFSNGMWKRCLRRAMSASLPAEVIERRGKIAPTAILERGLKYRAVDRVWGLMTDMRAAELGFVDEAKLHEHYREYLDGRHGGASFWYTLTLEDWLRRYF